LFWVERPDSDAVTFNGVQFVDIYPEELSVAETLVIDL
jgi:hypothetical protein